MKQSGVDYLMYVMRLKIFVLPTPPNWVVISESLQLATLVQLSTHSFSNVLYEIGRTVLYKSIVDNHIFITIMTSDLGETESAYLLASYHWLGVLNPKWCATDRFCPFFLLLLLTLGQSNKRRLSRDLQSGVKSSYAWSFWWLWSELIWWRRSFFLVSTFVGWRRLEKQW